MCPESMIFMVIYAVHCSPFSGHSGRQQTIVQVQLSYWRPDISYNINNFLHRCYRCQELVCWKPISSPLYPLPTVGDPNGRKHMDLFGPSKVRSANGSKYILEITEAFTKYTELFAINDKKAETVAKAFFESWVCCHSVWRKVLLWTKERNLSTKLWRSCVRCKVQIIHQHLLIIPSLSLKQKHITTLWFDIFQACSIKVRL